jgi:chorismate mutase/prephenate dehydratase
MLMPEIEDRPDNTTRFLVVGRKAFPASGIDKTTLLLSIAHTMRPARCSVCSSRSPGTRSA